MIRQLFSLACCGLMLTASVSAAELEIGTAGPEFSGVGLDDKEVSLESMKDADAVVLVFTCNACPVAKAYEERMNDFVADYKDKKVSFVAINCNNKTENLEAMKAYAKEAGLTFSYIYDEDASSSKAYGAKVTPHIFVLDKERKLAYRGAWDDSMRSPSNHYVKDAVDAVLAGKTPETQTTNAFGCGIKAKRSTN